MYWRRIIRKSYAKIVHEKNVTIIDSAEELFRVVGEKFGKKKFYLHQRDGVKISDDDFEFPTDVECKSYYMKTNFPENKNFRVIFYNLFLDVDGKIYSHNISSGEHVNFVIFCSHKLIFAAHVIRGTVIEEEKKYLNIFGPRNQMEEILYDDIKSGKIQYIPEY
jgi:hypothetical protein